MKNIIYITTLSLILSLTLSCNKKNHDVPDLNIEISPLSFDSINEWKSGFLISWRGTVDENIRAAKALGYRYINETCENSSGTTNYGIRPESKGMRFYLDNPEYSWVPDLDYIDPNIVAQLKTESFGSIFANYPKMNLRVKDQFFIDLKAFNPSVYDKVKATYEKYCCIVDGTTQFPQNLTLGWVFSDGMARVVLDWQQKKVIDLVVGQIIKLAHERENIANDYTFAGITMDYPEKWNEFSRKPAYNHSYSNYSLDPGLSGYEVSGTKHDYPTFREGWMRFLLSLRERLTTEFSANPIHFLLEPWKIWGDGYCGWWGYWLDSVDGAPFLTNAEKKKVVGDLILIEGPFITQFYDQNIIGKLSSSGLTSFDNMASSSPDLGDLYYDFSTADTHLNYIGKLALKGSWFNSYGCVNRGATTIKQRLPQLTLSRLLVNWQNLSMIPIKERTWDAVNQVYDSPIGHADRNIIYGKEPRKGKYFAAWVNNTGVMKLKKGEKVVSARATNEYYEENGVNSKDAMSSFTIEGETITLSGSGKLSQCYIITVKSN